MHKSVLLKEIIDSLNLKEDSVLVDATVNGGGMSEEALKRMRGKLKLICIDADEGALEKARERLGHEGVTFLKGNFGNLKELLRSANVTSIDAIMFDLGLSSNQLDASGRGFSFRFDEPLLMTFAAQPGKEALTAYAIVNEWDEENIETIIRSYGEERRAKRIAERIVEKRKEGPIKTSKELGDIIEKALGRHGKIHPATKTFQALRMTVNDELGNLKRGLEQAFELLSPEGRMAVISFHSLEDRIVKNFIREKADAGLGKRITKKPIAPSRQEMTENPRSRSAKLRILEKII